MIIIILQDIHGNFNKAMRDILRYFFVDFCVRICYTERNRKLEKGVELC